MLFFLRSDLNLVDHGLGLKKWMEIGRASISVRFSLYFAMENDDKKEKRKKKRKANKILESIICLVTRHHCALGFSRHLAPLRRDQKLTT